MSKRNDAPSAQTILSLLDGPIAFHRSFVTLTGNVTTALMLSQALYWSNGRTRKVGGWFYKTQREWQEETGLTRREQDAARRRLRQFDWWEESLKKANGVPTLHFRLGASGLYRDLLQVLERTEPVTPQEEIKIDDGNPVCTDAPNRIARIRQTDLRECAKPDCANTPNPITETTNRDYTETTDRESASADADAPHPPAPDPDDSFEAIYGKGTAGFDGPPVAPETHARPIQEEWDKPLCEMEPHRAMFVAVLDAIGWDRQTLAERDRAQVAQVCGVLRDADYEYTDVGDFMKRIWFNDWRWTQNHSRPTLRQLRQEIGKIRAVAPDEPVRKTQGGQAVSTFFDRLDRQGIEVYQ